MRTKEPQAVKGKMYVTKYVATKGILVFEGGHISFLTDGTPGHYYPTLGGFQSFWRGEYTQDAAEAKRQAQAKLLAAKKSAQKKLHKIIDQLDILNDWEG